MARGISSRVFRHKGQKPLYFIVGGKSAMFLIPGFPGLQLLYI